MAYTKRNDFPGELPLHKTQYCFICHSVQVTKQNNDIVTYHCTSCRETNGRVLIYDPKMAQYFDEDLNLVHTSAGMIIINPENMVLLFLRRKYPYLYTIPAGHIETGEIPQTAAVRETLEEVGVTVKNERLAFEGMVRGDECLGGADIHFWYLYIALVDSTEMPVLDEEGSTFGWFSIDTLPPNMTYPVKFFLEKEDILRKLQDIRKSSRVPLD